MQLTTEQLKTYEDQGYLLLPNCFAPGEVEVMRTEANYALNIMLLYVVGSFRTS